MLTFSKKTMLQCGRTRPFVSKGIALILFLNAISACFLISCGTYDLRITNEDINKRLAEKFPVTKTYLLLYKTTFSNPRVVLHENTDRVSLGIDVATEMPSRRQRESIYGTVTVTSGLLFNSKKGQLFLKDPVIESLSLADAGGSRKLEIKELLRTALLEYLASMPVYTLKANDTKKSIVRHAVKDVRVSNGVLIVTLGY